MEKYLFLVFDAMSEQLDFNLVETGFSEWSSGFNRLADIHDKGLTNVLVIKVTGSLPGFFEQLSRDLRDPEKYENLDEKIRKRD